MSTVLLVVKPQQCHSMWHKKDTGSLWKSPWVSLVLNCVDPREGYESYYWYHSAETPER